MTTRAGASAGALAALGVLGVLGVLGGCSSGAGDQPDPTTTPESAMVDEDTETAAADGASVTGTVGGADGVVVAESTDTVELHTAPQATSSFTPVEPDPTSGRSVFIVVEELGDWLHVRLPSGDARERAWVLRSQVDLSRHRFRIEVSRATHTLTVRSGDAEALRTQIAIGPDAPPAGSDLFIKDLVASPEPRGPYGRFAYGLSGASNEPGDFRTGSGVVAIHGTNDPAMLGTDVPAGSIAVAEGDLTRMVETLGLPLGTPVDVVD